MRTPVWLQQWFAVDGKLDDHMFGTYLWLRRGLILASASLPVLLWVGGAWAGLPDQASMSAYYFAAANEATCATFPMRGVFVGILCAISTCLFLYKGFSAAEDFLLNIAGGAGIVVAWVPMALGDEQIATCQALRAAAEQQAGQWPWHWLAAMVMFACLAVVSLTCAMSTLKLLPARHEHLKIGFRAAYVVIGFVMMAVVLVGGLFTDFVQQHRSVFLVEAVAIWTFTAYWAVKTCELFMSRADAARLSADAARARHSEEAADTNERRLRQAGGR